MREGSEEIRSVPVPAIIAVKDSGKKTKTFRFQALQRVELDLWLAQV
jgi:hypothetical protein